MYLKLFFCWKLVGCVVSSLYIKKNFSRLDFVDYSYMVHLNEEMRAWNHGFKLELKAILRSFTNSGTLSFRKLLVVAQWCSSKINLVGS